MNDVIESILFCFFVLPLIVLIILIIIHYLISKFKQIKNIIDHQKPIDDDEVSSDEVSNDEISDDKSSDDDEKKEIVNKKCNLFKYYVKLFGKK